MFPWRLSWSSLYFDQTETLATWETRKWKGRNSGGPVNAGSSPHTERVTWAGTARVVGRPLRLSTGSGEKFPRRDRIRWDTRLTQADRQRECEMPPKRYGIRSWWEAMTSSRPGISNVCNFKRFLDLPLMEPLHGINSHADVRRDLLSAYQWRGVDISAFLAINKWERDKK